MTPLRVGLVGLGRISEFYLRALPGNERIQLAAVCDVVADKLSPFRSTVPCFDSLEAMLAEGEIDGVIVNVPNDAHVAVCRAALTAGKHVCVEKPLATSYTDAEALCRLARDVNLTLFTAFHRRYNRNVRRLLAEVAPLPVDAVRVRYLEKIEDHIGDDRWYLDPARCGGGCIADNGPNAFDLVLQLVPDVSVRQAAVSWRDGIDIAARIELESRTGVRVEVVLDWAYPYGELKDLDVETGAGRFSADMLGGFSGFKSSLGHEYEALLADFEAATRHRDRSGEAGLAAQRLVADAYAAADAGLPGTVLP